MFAVVEKELSRLGSAVPEPFTVTFSDGSRYRNRRGSAKFAVRFKSRAAELAIAAYGHVGLLDGYFDGDIDIDGDLRAALRLGMQAGFDTPKALVAQRNRWHEMNRSNATREQARENARAHYGLGTEFFRLWLDDPLMMYTCAYWAPGIRTLEAAQAAKIDHVSRKLQLARGERVVDIGCGFGGFMFRASARHGVDVTGVNTTPEQVDAVDGWIRERKLGKRLRVVLGDMRDAFAQFDKVVSIGTLEHAGRDQLKDVVRAHADFLRPGGLGMLHFIGHVGRRDTEYFIREHVFPGGWIPSLADTIVAMEECGLEVVDIENLRRHYALTLDEWAARFDRRWERVQALNPQRFDERFRRIWRCYLLGCAEMFRSPISQTHLFQIVFSKGNVSQASYPMSRAFLYDAAARGGRRR
ncbi:MAG TPA: cyclopropane-fatty-acyl-phospholipid synthase family protein [Casimicrobiaceae bacterium]|nr:cyclopropane-fatty-acyl-phospholipid synthase family protein [Casimicrobiaceae bacterium]